MSDLVRRSRYAVATVFCVHGAVTGSFATRVPWIQEHSGVSAGQLGLALAFPALGAALMMPLAARVSHTLGTRNALRGLLALWTLALILPSLCPNLLTLCGALLVYGGSAGMADVAMNALGVEVEHRLGKSIMSGLHGMWSVGALIGSAVGTVAAHAGLSAQVHHALAAAVLTVIGAVVCQFVLNLHPEDDEEPPARFALTMAIARISGDAVVDRFGAVRTVRWSGVIATLGGVLVVVASHPVVAMMGFGLIGIGIAVAVPLAFAAAGHTGPNPSQAIAGVATITYASGLVAPSIIGGIAQASNLTISFIVVTALAVGLAVFAPVLRTHSRVRA